MTDTTPPDGTAPARNVITALAAIMHELPAIGKADKSPEGYAYRGIEAITKHLQPLLAKHYVIIVPSTTIVDVRPSPAMRDGWQDVQITVDWRIFGPGGPSDVIEARTVGVGRDKSDKGANKAQTQAYKYLLLHLLAIADKADDADGFTYEHDRVEQTSDPISARAADLYSKVVATKDTPLAAVLKGFAADEGKRLTAREFMHSPAFAAQIEDLINTFTTDEGEAK